MGGKIGDNIVNLPFDLDYHTLVTCTAREPLLLLFFWNMKFHMNSTMTLVCLNILYEVLSFLSTFQKCTTAK